MTPCEGPATEGRLETGSATILANPRPPEPRGASGTSKTRPKSARWAATVNRTSDSPNNSCGHLRIADVLDWHGHRRVTRIVYTPGVSPKDPRCRRSPQPRTRLRHHHALGSGPASDRVPVTSRYAATKGQMAQRIVRSAHEGVRDAHQLVGRWRWPKHGARAVAGRQRSLGSTWLFGVTGQKRKSFAHRGTSGALASRARYVRD